MLISDKSMKFCKLDVFDVAYMCALHVLTKHFAR